MASVSTINWFEGNKLRRIGHEVKCRLFINTLRVKAMFKRI
jgi:hypothetical protein